MKNTGIVRKLDELGRITLPIELRRNLGVGERDPLEIFVEDEKIILQKYEPTDIFDAVLKRLLDAIESCELTLMTPNADAYTELYLYILNNFVKEQKYDVEVQTEKAMMSLPNNNRLSVLKKMFETECDFSDLGKWKGNLQELDRHSFQDIY